MKDFIMPSITWHDNNCIMRVNQNCTPIRICITWLFNASLRARYVLGNGDQPWIISISASASGLFSENTFVSYRFSNKFAFEICPIIYSRFAIHLDSILIFLCN